MRPIALPNVDDAEIADETVCVVSGWGHINNHNESSNILRAVEVPIVNRKMCQESYIYTHTITPQMICAGHYKQGGIDSKKSLSFVNFMAFYLKF